MMNLAQIGDVCSPQGWLVFLIFGFGCPLMGLLAGHSEKSDNEKRRARMEMSVYYLVSVLMLLSASISRLETIACVCLLCALIGPFVGLRLWGKRPLRYLTRRPPGYCQKCGYRLIGNMSGRCPGCHPRRYPLGHCEKCGYNLTGNVSGICPECGTVIESTEKTV